jgi:hypothetical protein
MTERVTRPADADKVGWRTDPGGNPILEPNASKRLDGWAYEEKWPHQEANWQLKLHGDLWLWLNAFLPREWLDLKQGIDAATAPQRFVVTRPGTGNLWRGYEFFSEPTQSGYRPTAVTTDGRRVYYIDTDAVIEGQNVVAMDPEDGSQLWSQPKTYTQFVGLASDGDRVYSTEAGANGVDVRDPSTGAVTAHGGTQGELRFLAVNGEHLIGEYNRFLYFLNALSTVPVEIGSIDYGADVYATTIDAFRAYVTGDQAAAAGLFRSYNLFDQSLQWSVDPPTTAQPNGRALATDGDWIYAGTSHATLTAGGDVNLFVLDVHTGLIVGQYEIGTHSDDVINLAVDDKFLYVTTENFSPSYHRELHVIDLRSPLASTPPRSVIPVETTQDREAWAADGVGVVMVNHIPVDVEIRRDLMHPYPRSFQRVSGSDPGRLPFFNSAIPI